MRKHFPRTPTETTTKLLGSKFLSIHLRYEMMIDERGLEFLIYHLVMTRTNLLYNPTDFHVWNLFSFQLHFILSYDEHACISDCQSINTWRNVNPIAQTDPSTKSYTLYSLSFRNMAHISNDESAYWHLLIET